MKANFLIFFLFCGMSMHAQQSIDGSFAFQSDPAKLYSAYIPSTYNPDVAHRTIIGFHPFNTSRWDAEAWRDTLLVFAESVDAILICPDGGPDGKVDDAIDTAFTSFLLDTFQSDYNIDMEQLFLAGFSWGGRTAYTYGLHRPGMFQGALISGAAVNGTNEVSNVLSNANGENYYLVHGSSDNLNNRHTIISEALLENDACVESNILIGIGHTIDYPNRNQILKDGFDYLLANACVISSIEEKERAIQLDLFPNPSNGFIQIRTDMQDLKIDQIYDTNGNQVSFRNLGDQAIQFSKHQSGLFIVHFKNSNGLRIQKKIFID